MVKVERQRAPVIADVAARAGVSVPTVSRVLTGTARVSPERRARVLQAVAELGYRPNGAARALAMGAQQLVTVLAGNTTRYGYASTIQGIEEAAREAGYIVTIAVVEGEDVDRVKRTVDQVAGQPMAGVIVLEFDPAGVAAVKALPSWLPVVVVCAGTPLTGSPSYVSMDDHLAARRATSYLLDLGHATVHHISIPAAGGESARTAGWREALLAAGAPVPAPHISDWSPLAGYEVARRLLTSGEQVTAVLAGNDELAMGVIRAATDLGIDVPRRLSVVGFDDEPLSVLWNPSLTTVRQDFVRQGSEAMHMLLQGSTGPVRLVPELIVRSSTGPAPR